MNTLLSESEKNPIKVNHITECFKKISFVPGYLLFEKTYDVKENENKKNHYVLIQFLGDALANLNLSCNGDNLMVSSVKIVKGDSNRDVIDELDCENNIWKWSKFSLDNPFPLLAIPYNNYEQRFGMDPLQIKISYVGKLKEINMNCKYTYYDNNTKKNIIDTFHHKIIEGNSKKKIMFSNGLCFPLYID